MTNLYPQARRDESVVENLFGHEVCLDAKNSSCLLFFYPVLNVFFTCYDDCTIRQRAMAHLFDLQIADPYRWLEQADSTETREFVTSLNAFSRPFFDEFMPLRQRIEERLTQMWNYEKYGCPARRGQNYFYSYNSGLQNQRCVR